jgi:hypothetical protein
MNKATKRKTFTIDRDVAYALETLARDKGGQIDSLAEQAFRDFLKKQGRPITVEDALRQSVRVIPANDRAPPAKKRLSTKRRP